MHVVGIIIKRYFTFAFHFTIDPFSWPVKIYSSSGPHTAAVTLDSSDNILRYGSPKKTKILWALHTIVIYLQHIHCSRKC